MGLLGPAGGHEPHNLITLAVGQFMRLSGEGGTGLPSRFRTAKELQHSEQGVGVHRLDQMMLEPGFVRAPAVLVLPVGSHGDQTGLRRGGLSRSVRATP
jgi:hypothetical protein